MPTISDYLRQKKKSRWEVKNEIIVFDLVNDRNVEDSGLGIGYGDFHHDLFQPREKTFKKRIEEILNEVRRRILLMVMVNKKVLIIIQLGFWWWWKWSEEKRLRELTTINNGGGWKSFSEEQKTKWKKWNKELNKIAERLIEWLTINNYRWIYVVDRKIKEFINNSSFNIQQDISTNNPLTTIIRRLNNSSDLNRNNKDVIAMILMYHEGLLNWFEEVKNRLGDKYYWNNHERINGKN